MSHEAINLHTSTHYSFVTFCDIASHVCYIVLILFDIYIYIYLVSSLEVPCKGKGLRASSAEKAQHRPSRHTDEIRQKPQEN